MVTDRIAKPLGQLSIVGKCVYCGRPGTTMFRDVVVCDRCECVARLNREVVQEQAGDSMLGHVERERVMKLVMGH